MDIKDLTIGQAKELAAMFSATQAKKELIGEYVINGWYFEFHRWLGPHPLNKDGDPRKTPPGRKFWKMWDKFYALSEAERGEWLEKKRLTKPVVSKAKRKSKRKSAKKARRH